MSVVGSVKPEKLLTPSLLDAEQQAAVTRLVEHDHTLLHAGMGAGKTVIALTALAELFEMSAVKRVLVVAPLAVADTVWRSELRVWSHLQGLRVAHVLGTAKQRMQALGEGAQIDVINFENLAWLASMTGMLSRYDALLVDESTKMADVGAGRFRAFRRYIKHFKWRCVMTGTPVAEGLDKLYAQMLLVDGGETLGRRKDRFLEEYFTALDYERRQWTPKPFRVPELLKQVGPYVHSVPDYRGELPELTVRWEDVFMPKAAREKYELLKADGVLDEGVIAANEAVLTGKLLQAASGFVYRDDREQDPVWLHDEKWIALDEVLSESDEPTLIVYQWQTQKAALQALGVPGYTSKRLLEWNRGELPLMAIHPRSCGHGLNLQHGGRRIVMLNPGWSKDQHDQIIARVWRRGQTRPVEVVVLTCVASMDEVAKLKLEGKARWEALFREHLGG